MIYAPLCSLAARSNGTIILSALRLRVAGNIFGDATAIDF